MRPSEGFVIFPGGFGTLDEMYESLTLIQTGKIRHFPVVLFDSDYWGELLDWIRGELLADGMISPDDIELLHLTDDPGRGGAARARALRQREPTTVAPHKQDARTAQAWLGVICTPWSSGTCLRWTSSRAQRTATRSPSTPRGP